LRDKVILALLTCFVIITLLVVFDVFQPVDDLVLPFFAVPPDLVLPFSIVSDFLGTYIWLIICIPLFTSKKVENIVSGFLILINFGLGLLIKFIFSILITRPRPPNFTPFPLEGNSYPSGHTIRSFACAIPIILRKGLVFKSLFVISIITGITRMMIQVHFLSDILAGAILGLLIGLLCTDILQRLKYVGFQG
jgi:undecaprenyl-diphosphatase